MAIFLFSGCSTVLSVVFLLVSTCAGQEMQKCGVETCTQEILDTNACAGNDCYSCGDRINYLIGTGFTETAACLKIARDEFPSECGPCLPDVPSSAPTPSIPPPNDADLVWSDEFSAEGAPNPEKWGYDVGGGGWGNNELQFYTNRLNNAFVSNGSLNIRAVKEDYGGRQYTSARLVSKNKGDFKYGRMQFRARLKQCTARGSWAALWMLPTDWVYGGWPDSGEIDIMEHVGYDKGRVHGTVHTRAFNHGDGTQVGNSIIATVEDWHVYDIIWGEERIDFIIDGVRYHDFENRQISYKEWPFDERFHLIMNIAVGGNWGGLKGVDEKAFEGDGQIMEVDWVRVYKEPSICTGLDKKQCRNVKDSCAYGKGKIKGPCVHKKKKFKHECSQYDNEDSCLLGDHAGLCKFNEGVCSHACDGLKGNVCKKFKNTSNNQKICKLPKLKNPCKGCMPKTCGD